MAKVTSYLVPRTSKKEKVTSHLEKSTPENNRTSMQNFYTADEYHQDYLDKNPQGYCHLPTSLFELARQAKDPSKR